MRWMAWNAVGCAMWLAGLSYAKGMSLPGLVGAGSDAQHVATGLGIGVVGLLLLSWVNLIDAA